MTALASRDARRHGAVAARRINGPASTGREDHLRQLLEAAAALGLRIEDQVARLQTLEDELTDQLMEAAAAPVEAAEATSALAGAPDEVEEPALDRRGRKPSPVVLRGYRKGVAPATKGTTRNPEPLSPEEVHAIIRQTSRRGHAGRRDKALIVVLWRCGLRIAEALDLQIRDVDLDNGFLRVQHGKGDKYRMAALDATAEKVLRDWLDRRSRIPGIQAGKHVFCTISQPAPGLRMGAPAFRSKLKRLAKRAGIDRDVYPHQLRHTCARDMINDGLSILVVKEQLGHEHVSTTEHYIGRMMPDVWLKQVRDRPGVEFIDLPAIAPPRADAVLEPTPADCALALELLAYGGAFAIAGTATATVTEADRVESVARVVEHLRGMSVAA